jgi:hypothetical protein
MLPSQGGAQSLTDAQLEVIAKLQEGPKMTLTYKASEAASLPPSVVAKADADAAKANDDKPA